MSPPLDPPSLADLSPSLVFCYLQALLEAQQLGAVMGQASAQARGGPKGGSSSLTEVEEGSAADHAAAAARDAVTEATPLTEADHKYLAQAEKAADKADKAAAGVAAAHPFCVHQGLCAACDPGFEACTTCRLAAGDGH